jgi:hypothetical protein
MSQAADTPFESVIASTSGIDSKVAKTDASPSGRKRLRIPSDIRASRTVCEMNQSGHNDADDEATLEVRAETRNIVYLTEPLPFTLADP